VIKYLGRFTRPPVIFTNPKGEYIMEDKKEKEKEVTEEVAKVQTETPCKDDDKACTRRWIESLGDCG
jgi:hypothetical protein